MEAQQESSDINNKENKDMKTMDPNFDSAAESPIVTSLHATPFPQSAIRSHAATLRKIQE